MGSEETLAAIEAPRPSVGAPLPHIFSDEDALFVAYFVEWTDPLYGGDYPVVASPADVGETVAVLSVVACTAFNFGPPSEDTVAGHRLSKQGLRPHAAFEVKNSSWIADLEVADRVDPDHRAERFADKRHFIFSFHDTTLEFVAAGFSVDLRRGSVFPTLMDVVFAHREAMERERSGAMDALIDALARRGS